MATKSSNLIIRVSEEWKHDLQRVCRNKGRSMTGHIEHSLKIAKFVTDYCGGNDDLDHVQRTLIEMRRRLVDYPEAKSSMPIAAETPASSKPSSRS